MDGVPQHVGVILDGNRRWAKERHLPAFEGHRRGKDNLHTIAVAARDRGIKYLTVYAFSTENWQRAQQEVDFLMELLVTVATREIDRYVDEGIKVLFIGSRHRLSARVLKALESAEARTAHNEQIVLGLCINYGGQLELVEAVQQLISDGVKVNDVNQQTIERYLYQPQVPPMDLVIRTSGEQRLSNFMLWRAAYAELYFTPVFWPAFEEKDLDEALDEYRARSRRYGK